MTVADVASGRFEIGRVATRTFEVIRGNFVPFFLLGLIATIPTTAYTVAVSMHALPQTIVGVQDPHTIKVYLVSLGAAGIAGAFLGLVLQAALTYCAIGFLSGKPVTLGHALAIGLRLVLPLLAIGILEGLAIMGAALALVFPALMLYAMWAVVVPVRVAENTAIFESFGRSRTLTAGYRWPIFGTIFVFFLGAGIAQNIARVLLNPAATGQGTVSLYLAVIFNVLVTAIVAVASAALVSSIYYELRLIKEGVGPQQIAAVFD